MEPGIRTRLTNLLAMVAAPEKYDKNVKLKFPLEFYLKKTLEFVKNIKVTAPAIVEALAEAESNDIEVIQEYLHTHEGQIHVGVDLPLLNAIGTYANDCANTLLTTSLSVAYGLIEYPEYAESISNLYKGCLYAFNVAHATPYIAINSSPFTFMPINSCYNNRMCGTFDVLVNGLNQGEKFVIHYSMFIETDNIKLIATKTGPFGT